MLYYNHKFIQRRKIYGISSYSFSIEDFERQSRQNEKLWIKCFTVITQLLRILPYGRKKREYSLNPAYLIHT